MLKNILNKGNIEVIIFCVSLFNIIRKVMIEKKYIELLHSLNQKNIDSKILKSDIIYYKDLEKENALIINKNFKNYLKRNNFKILYYLSFIYFDINYFLKILNNKKYGEIFMEKQKVVDCTSENLGVGEVINTKYEDKKGLIYIIKFKNGKIKELQASEIDYL